MQQGDFCGNDDGEPLLAADDDEVEDEIDESVVVLASDMLELAVEVFLAAKWPLFRYVLVVVVVVVLLVVELTPSDLLSGEPFNW